MILSLLNFDWNTELTYQSSFQAKICKCPGSEFQPKCEINKQVINACPQIVGLAGYFGSFMFPIHGKLGFWIKKFFYMY